MWIWAQPPALVPRPIFLVLFLLCLLLSFHQLLLLFVCCRHCSFRFHCRGTGDRQPLHMRPLTDVSLLVSFPQRVVWNTDFGFHSWRRAQSNTRPAPGLASFPGLHRSYRRLHAVRITLTLSAVIASLFPVFAVLTAPVETPCEPRQQERRALERYTRYLERESESVCISN